MIEIIAHRANPNDDSLICTVVGEPGPGGANHQYVVKLTSGNAIMIQFQKGGVVEHGVNGLTHEVLLAIVADRLSSFQKGPFPSDYNATALTHINAALETLHRRTSDRIARGVEGLEKK